MPLVVDIDAAELEGLALRLEVDKKAMLAAIRRAANRAVAWGKTQIARGLSSRLGVPTRAMDKRLRARKASVRATRASLWVALNPLNAERAGASATAIGLRAGGRDFVGAFVATGRFGGKAAMRRVGNSRLPLESAAFDVIAEAPRVVTGESWPGLNEKFLEFYMQELERRAR